MAFFSGLRRPPHPLLGDVMRFAQEAEQRRGQPLTEAERRRAVRATYGPPASAPRRSGFLSMSPPANAPRRSEGSIRPHIPSGGEAIGNSIGDVARSLGFSNAYAHRLGSEATNIPVLGDLMTAADAGTSFRGGNYLQGAGQAALAGIGLIPGVGDAAAAGARRLGKLEEFMREGSERYLMYTMPDGTTANMHVVIDPDGVAEISVDPFSRDPNRFGPAVVRDAASQIRELYPEIKTFWGARQSGANPGRVQRVPAR